MTLRSDWQSKAVMKRESCFQAIPKDWILPESSWLDLRLPLAERRNNLIETQIVRRSGILTERELEITENYQVSDLLAGLANGKFSSLEVTLAFSKRAAIAQQLTSCLTEVLFDRARERALYLDNLRSKTGRLAGPLHGLPISIKDGFQIMHTQATIGLVSYLDKYSSCNSPLVDILLDLGAVLYVKTNIPQTLMTADSHNNIFGRVLNPHNTMLGAGGSSGGEGALVAFRGSPLGVGTDVAGSVRMPALACGTYGFRPTTSRIPYGGQSACANPGLRFVLSCAGPLANDLEALGIFMKTILEVEPANYDPTAIHSPWRDVMIKDDVKLRFGVMAEEVAHELHPPVRRVLEEAARKLESAGHEIVSLTREEGSISALCEVGWQLMSLDSHAADIVRAAGEPLVPSIANVANEVAKQDWPFAASLTGMASLQRLAAINVRRAELISQWHSLWSKHRLDAVLSPSARSTAVSHDTFGLFAYTLFLNTLDYPACVLPFGRVDKSVDITPTEPSPGQPQFDAEMMDGSPGSIQIFTNRMRDEECLAIAHVVDRCLRSTAKPVMHFD